MSGATIAPYFPFRRIKIKGQVVASQANRVLSGWHPTSALRPCAITAAKKPPRFTAGRAVRSGT